MLQELPVLSRRTFDPYMSLQNEGLMSSIARVLLRLVLLGVVIIIFCEGCPVCKNDQKTLSQMTGEEARAATITMVEHSDYEDLKMAMPFLQSAAITKTDADPSVVHIGQWRFDLNKRTLVVTVDAPPIFCEYQGVFESSPGKGWRARITDIKQN